MRIITTIESRGVDQFATAPQRADDLRSAHLSDPPHRFQRPYSSVTVHRRLYSFSYNPGSFGFPFCLLLRIGSSFFLLNSVLTVTPSIFFGYLSSILFSFTGSTDFTVHSGSCSFSRNAIRCFEIDFLRETETNSVSRVSCFFVFFSPHFSFAFILDAMFLFAVAPCFSMYSLLHRRLHSFVWISMYLNELVL